MKAFFSQKLFALFVLIPVLIKAENIHPQNQQPEFVYVTQAMADTLKKELNEFCDWTKTEGASLIQKTISEFMQKATELNIDLSGGHAGQYWGSIIEAIHTQIIDHLEKKHEEKNIPHETALEKKFYHTIYTCATYVVQSAAPFSTMSIFEPKTYSYCYAQLFPETIETIFHDFIVPAIEFCTNTYVEVSVKTSYFQEYGQFATFIYGAGFFYAHCYGKVLDNPDRITAIPEDIKHSYKEEMRATEQMKIFRCNMAMWFEFLHGASPSFDERLNEIYKKLIVLCDDYERSWVEYCTAYHQCYEYCKKDPNLCSGMMPPVLSADSMLLSFRKKLEKTLHVGFVQMMVDAQKNMNGEVNPVIQAQLDAAKKQLEAMENTN